MENEAATTQYSIFDHMNKGMAAELAAMGSKFFGTLQGSVPFVLRQYCEDQDFSQQEYEAFKQGVLSFVALCVSAANRQA